MIPVLGILDVVTDLSAHCSEMVNTACHAVGQRSEQAIAISLNLKTLKRTLGKWRIGMVVLNMVDVICNAQFKSPGGYVNTVFQTEGTKLSEIATVHISYDG